MVKHLDAYIDKLINSVYKKISEDLSEASIYIEASDIMIHTKEPKLIAFHKYYLQIKSNKNAFTSSNIFFRDFKRHYALQGISNYYLDKKLEKHKAEILKLIEEDRLFDLYFTFFKKAEIQKENSPPIIKSLGSFFTKLVHTFNPSNYCALDNPIKEYFGLKTEGFYISFLIISYAYKNWITANSNLVKLLRQYIVENDVNNFLQSSELTDFKILDLIFWTKVNLKTD